MGSLVDHCGIRPFNLGLVTIAMVQVRFVYRQRKPYLVVRRLFNVTVAVLALVFALPLLAIAALAILIEDGRPVLFMQRRVGRFERIFPMYKLRTMRKRLCVDAVSPESSRDERITRVGRWLRRTSIDELPQLVNVICGHMSLVGPRPEMPFIVKRYENWQHLRHFVEPGITGLWQTECRSRIPLARPEATILDLEYISRASARVDGMLLVRTVKAVFTADGAV
jgi:lipopolysaccharide/colanic/teichoic acid biosynthesis glycosyltransferase